MSNCCRPHRLALCATTAAFAALAAHGDGFTYRTSWVGNTFGGADGVFVQMDARTLFTAPDGACFLNVPWEEGGQQAGLYRDGKVLGNPGQTHGWGDSGGFAVVANEKHIYIAQRKDSEGGHGADYRLAVSRHAPDDRRARRHALGRAGPSGRMGPASDERTAHAGPAFQFSLFWSAPRLLRTLVQPSGIAGRLRSRALDGGGRRVETRTAKGTWRKSP